VHAVARRLCNVTDNRTASDCDGGAVRGAEPRQASKNSLILPLRGMSPGLKQLYHVLVITEIEL
jgi:hypothetical protein